MVVDVHTHILPASIYEAARSGTPWHGIDFALNPEGKLTWDIEGRAFTLPWEDPGQTLKSRIETMDEQGVDVHLLSLSPTLWHWYRMPLDVVRPLARDVNESLALTVEEHPTRFQALAFLPLQDGRAAAEELEFTVTELGLVGAAVGTNAGGLDWDAPELYPVLETAAGLGAMLFIHPANGRFPREARYHLRNIVGNPLETTMAVASLVFGGVFDRLPDLRVAVAHGGGYACMGLGRMDHARGARKECQDIAGLPSDYARRIYWDSLTHSHGALRFLLDTVGSGQVVLGTDYPADMSQEDPVRWLRSADVLNDAEQDAILGGNVRALFGPRGARVRDGTAGVP